MPDDGTQDTLSDHEREVVSSVRLCEVYVPAMGGEGSKPSIRAETIRRLILDLPAADRTGSIASQNLGVRLRGCSIMGPLDLTDLKCRPHSLPTLALDDCDIYGDINLDGAHLSRLSVQRSRIRKISLRHAEVAGAFDFSGARPFARKEGGRDPAWIDARNTIFRAQVTGSGASLQIPIETRAETELIGEGHRYALWLSSAEIHGNLQLRNRFKARGGISLDAARVHGHVLCDGAMLMAVEDDAFNAQSAQIDGNLHLCPDKRGRMCELLGTVWLLGARIGGYAHLRQARIRLSRPRPALVLDQANIGASIQLSDSHIIGGRVKLVGTHVRGNVECRGMQVRRIRPEMEGQQEPLPAFNASNADLEQDLSFHRAVFEASVDLTGARVKGMVAFDGATLQHCKTSDPIALGAIHLSVGGSLTFKTDAFSVEPAQDLAFTARGLIDLTGATINGDLEFSGWSITNWSKDGKSTALRAQRLRVTGGIVFEQFCAHGEVDLSGASVGRDLRCVKAKFLNAKAICVYKKERREPTRDDGTYGSAIYAKDIQIGDDLQFENVVVEGNLRFERADITGSVSWNGLHIQGRYHDKAPPPLDLQRARIGSALKAISLTFDGRQSEIDLTGARVPTIASWWPHGWGGEAPAQDIDHRCFLKLDGLVYDRVELRYGKDVQRNRTLRYHWNISRSFTSPPEHARGNLLLDWLLHQRRPTLGQEDFYPQPFRQLAKVLRAQGEEEAARTINMAEKLAMPTDDLLHRLFGTLFGFGQSRLRATVFLLAWITLGAGGVYWAQAHRLMVESALITTSSFKEDTGSEGMRRVFPAMMPGQKAADDVRCTDTAGDVATDVVYALDMIVPFIPLHQETKCEIDSGPGWLATSGRVAKAIYSILGWIFFSLWLVTFSGLLRRSDEAD